MDKSDARKRPPGERLPPHSIEAEQAVLGSILLDPQVLPLVITELISDESFYDLKHRTIYSVFVRLFDEGILIDTITVINRLKSTHQLESVGGIEYLSSLPDATPGAGNVKTYVDICVEKHLLRQLVAAAATIVSDAMDEVVPVADQMDQAEHRILKVSNRTAGKGAVSARVLVGVAMERLLELEQAENRITGLSSGFPDLDYLTAGFRGKEMTIVAARPSVGKSSLILNIADHLAVEQQAPVGILSLEMPADRMMERMLSSRARVDLRKLCNKNPNDAPKLRAASQALRNAPIYIDDERGQSLLKARAKARRMLIEHRIQILFIDYLQLLTAQDAKGHKSRAEEVGDISRGLHELAGELNIPVVVLSQLNRDLDKEKSRRPRLSDLRESGCLEQDADAVVLLYNDDTAGDGTTAMVKCDVAKNRYGATGHFELVFMKEFTRFESAARVEEEMPHTTEMFN